MTLHLPLINAAPPLEDLLLTQLSILERPVLVALLEASIRHAPGYREWLGTTLAQRQDLIRVTLPTPSSASSPTASPPPVPKQFPPVNLKELEHRMKRLLRGVTPGKWSGIDTPDALEPILHDADECLKRGDGMNALAILKMVCDEVVPAYDEYEGECELAMCLDSVGQSMAEAVLLMHLEPQTLQALHIEVEKWASQLGTEGDEAPFTSVLQALELKRVLGEKWGNAERLEGYGERSPRLRSPRLNEIILDALEHSGRWEDFLAVARLTGSHRRRLLRLIAQGRADEAVHELPESLENAYDILTIAKALEQAGALEAALTVAERGLASEEAAAEVGEWLGTLAQKLERPALALKAWQRAYEVAPTGKSFEQIRLLTSLEQWPEVRRALLERASNRASFDDAPIIYLAAGELDRALAHADAYPLFYDMVARVADAVLAERPEWVIHASKIQIQRLLERNKSKYYPHMVPWLKRMKASHTLQGTSDAWVGWLRSFRAEHSRKYALTAVLDGV